MITYLLCRRHLIKFNLDFMKEFDKKGSVEFQNFSIIIQVSKSKDIY